MVDREADSKLLHELRTKVVPKIDGRLIAAEDAFKELREEIKQLKALKAAAAPPRPVSPNEHEGETHGP